MKNKFMLKTGWRSMAASIALSACLVNFTACTKYDLDETTPEGWGATIYTYLAEDGNYTNTVRMIEDLGLKETLAKTGSKTMFVADDAAFARFYANNKWGVKSYEELSLSQKKLLLLGSMINSSYQVDDLSSLPAVSGNGDPLEGMCMRRISSQTVYDSVAVVKEQNLPNMTPETQQWNSTWKKFEGRGEVVLMKDMTVQPMLHFIEAMMNNNKITNDDYNFLYNYSTNRQPGDASVNGVKMIEQNIKCSNGFIHKMEDVIMPLENMAEIIESKPQVSIFNKLLQRFSAPYYVGNTARDQYNYLYGTSVDSVFQKRFFSKWSNGSQLSTDDDNGNHSEEMLKFDPGWNSYATSAEVTASSPLEVALQRNMGFMMVPSDAAMNDYWENGAGRVLKEQYGSWDNVPNKVIVDLINNNMISDFVNQGVPSKFSSILNDANDPMDVKPETIDSVWLGCNGAVYLTNKVYSPTTFVSVLYPAKVNETMKVIDWAVKECQYHVYLNSLHSRYSFFIPTNKAMLEYVAPASYGQNETKVYRFQYDPIEEKVWASIFRYDPILGATDSIGEQRDVYTIREMLKDVLDNHIVIGDVEDGNTYYKTKGGQEIKVNNARLGANGMTVEGSYQINDSFEPVRVSYVYDQTKDGNGKCYILDGQPIMTTRYSTIDMMRQVPEMSEFVKLLEGSGLLQTMYDENHATVSENVSVFNTYNYTVYVPTNEDILALQQAGQLPSWEKVNAYDENEYEAMRRDSLAIENFLRIHIQDGSLFIGAEPQAEDGFETALISEKTQKFVRIYPHLTSTDLTVKVSQTETTPAKVKKSPGLYNIMAREYILTSKDATDENNRVYTTSTAVIHLIDKPLIYKE